MKESEIRLSLYEKVAKIAQAIASPARLKIIQLLAQSPRSVETLGEMIGESVANTSQHLQRLLKENLVASTRQGTTRIYSIAHPEVLLLWESLQNLAAAASAEVAQKEIELTDISTFSDIELPAVLRKVKRKRATLLDVRPEEEASATEIKGAINIPLAQLKKRRAEIPAEFPVYVLCRGRYCSMATHAAVELRAAGFEAYRLKESPFKVVETLEGLD